MRNRSVSFAVALAPWAVVPVVVISGLGTSDAGLSSDFGWGLFFALLFGLPCAYLGMIIIGLPTFLLLRIIGRERSPILHVVATFVPFALFFEAGLWRESVAAGISGLAISLVAQAILNRGSGEAREP